MGPEDVASSIAPISAYRLSYAGTLVQSRCDAADFLSVPIDRDNQVPAVGEHMPASQKQIKKYIDSRKPPQFQNIDDFQCGLVSVRES
jgi:hypothetical protein